MALTLEEAQTRLSSIATGDTEALKNLINEFSSFLTSTLGMHIKTK